MSRNSRFRKLITWTTLVISLLTIVWPAGQALAYTETSRTSTKQNIAEGVTLERITLQTNEGQIKIFLTTVDLTNPYVKIDTMVGKNGVVTDNQAVGNMAKETGAIAAINGDFFQMTEDAPIGVTVQAGEVVTSPAMRTDMFGFGLTKDNRPLFPVFSFSGTITAPTGAQYQLFGVNKPSYYSYLPNDQNIYSDVNRLNMYNSRWGSHTRGPLKGLSGLVEVVVDNGIVTEIRKDQAGAAIPVNGFNLVGHGTAAQYLLQNFKVGDTVQSSYQVGPETDNLQMAVGGMALIVDQGKRHSFSHSVSGKNAMTTVGASQDGKTLYLMVVEESDTSRGMTMTEVADFMASLGIWTAVNLDGGGSSTMVARQLGDQSISLLNNPTQDSQRSIPSGIGIYSTAPAGAFAGMLINGPNQLLAGTKRAFSVKGYDEHYNPYSVAPGEITWETELGQFDGNVLTALKTGQGKVKATYNNISQEYAVKVLGRDDIAKVDVTPSSISLNPNDSVTLGVKVTTKQGAVFDLQPGEYEITVTGDVGTVSGNKFTATDRMSTGEIKVAVDSLPTTVKVNVGGIEKPFYGFETDKGLKYKDYPTGQTPGAFRLTKGDEPVFRGAGAARLDYDFTKSSQIRISYGSFNGGLPLPGQPLSLGLWVKGDGNGYWLRARVVDAAGKEKLIDFSKNVDWQGWKHVTANIPSGVKMPVKLTDLYLVANAGGDQKKGTVYFDELSLVTPPAAGETGTIPEALSASKDAAPGETANLNLGQGLSVTVKNPANVSGYLVSARQVWTTELPTPGYNPVMPLYNITAEADGDPAEKMPAPMSIRITLKNISNYYKARVMFWDPANSVWLPVQAQVDSKSGTVTATSDRLGLFGLFEDAHMAPLLQDISGSWAKDIIEEMSSKGIVKGYPDGRFLPSKGITRAEFISLLANVLGWSGQQSKIHFKDSIPSWAAGSIGAAVNKGVVMGYSDGTFQPQKVITRTEMAVIIDKALNLSRSNQPSNYTDAAKIPSWAVQSIRNVKTADIMKGSGNMFRPQDIANRAEATAVMARVLEYTGR